MRIRKQNKQKGRVRMQQIDNKKLLQALQNLGYELMDKLADVRKKSKH
jgi:hypothetical protein